MYSMAREIMTVRVESRTRKALDGIASALDRDRTYVVNDALQAYIDVHQWQIGHIRQGLREAKAGKFATNAEVSRVIARLRRK
jgi:predicted transcriptional regulator